MSWNFGMDFGSALGGLVGALSSNASAKKQFKYQSALQAQAAQLNYDYGIKSLKNSPSAQREGLQSAGYNPMLAVQNSTSGANSGWTTTGQAQNVDYAGDFASGLSNALNVQNMKNQTEQTESINDKNYAEADEAKVRKAALLERLPWISKREKAEIGNIEKDSVKKEAEIHNIEEITRFIEKDFELRKRLGEMGIDVQRRGQDISYNASTYASNKSYEASKYGADVKAETERGMRTDRLPFGFGSTYYDLRGSDKRMRANYINDRKYWRNYY